MTTTKRRIAALVLAALLAAAGAFASAATTFASDAYALGNTGNLQNDAVQQSAAASGD